MSNKKSGGALAIKKKPRATNGKPMTARPKLVASVRKAVKAPAKKPVAMTITKKPVAPSGIKLPVPVRKITLPLAGVKSEPVKMRGIYSVHPGVSMMQKWITELKAKTGRTLEEWIRFVQTSGPQDIGARRVWLKERHGLGTNSAWWIAERASPGGDAGIADDNPEAYLKAAVKYVEEMYAGGKAGLRPLHDRLIEIARSMGKDVRICPCKTIIPIYRRHVVAQIAPTSRTRIDFGLALRDTPASGRLIDTGGWERKDRITHRIPVSSLAEIDSEVERWLRFAYELDG